MSFWVKNDFKISTEKRDLDILAIHEFLSQTYWSKNRSFETIKKSIENSLCFGLFEHEKQIGFARIFSDFATMSYLCDVYVLPAYQKLGLGKWLVEIAIHYEPIQHTHVVLATKDKHSFYEQLGFKSHENPERIMVLHKT